MLSCIYKNPVRKWFAGVGVSAVILTVGTVAGLNITATNASAANLVTNGDFETGDITGWAVTGGIGVYGVASYGVGGSLGYMNGEYSDNPNTLSQSLATVAGQSYTFSFEVNPTVAPNIPNNGFTASWEGIPVFSFTDDPGVTFQSESFTVVATGSSTEIAFSGYNNPSAWVLDNVQVTASAAVPEAGTAALILPALGIIGTVVLHRRIAK